MNYLNKSESALRRDERDRHLTELYCEIFDNLKEKKVNNPRSVAISLALANGTPRYHVGFDRAYIVVAKLLNNGNVTFKSDLNRLMWLDLAKKVRSIMEQGKMSIAQAVPIVLEKCRASCFFISKEHAWVIIKRQLKLMHCRKPYGRID